MQAVIIVDGGDREGTFGSFIIMTNDGVTLAHKFSYWGVGDHNHAEYLALISALTRAEELGIISVQVLSDSETVIEQVHKRRAVHNRELRQLRDTVLEKLLLFDTWSLDKITGLVVKGVLGH